MQNYPDRNLINNLSESHPILFAKFAGRQEFRLKIKQGEGVSGPKVKMELIKLPTFDINKSLNYSR